MSAFDILVLGGGPGGYVAAIKAAQHGLKVGLIEKENVGGACLNWGCIPTKTLLKSAKLFSQMHHAKDYGINLDLSSLSMDFKALMKRKDKAVKKLTGGVRFLLKNNGVTLIEGFGKALNAHAVEVAGQTYETKHLILATGASPFIPPIDGLKEAYEAGHAVSSKELLDITQRPQRLVIIGGGVIGVEFATVFNALGTEVTIFEREDDILTTVDGELRQAFKQKLSKDGVNIHTGASVVGVNGSSVTVEEAGQTRTVESDLILVSVGMRPNLGGLEALGLNVDKGAVVTDEFLCTNVPKVYAIGDMNGKYQLAHVASKEGLVAVDHILGHAHAMDYGKVPSGIYTFPEIAQVGLTEEAAQAASIDYTVATFPLVANGKALAEGEQVGLVKMLMEPQYGEIIGVHIMAQNATEMISEAVLGMHLEATASDYIAAIHPHPTLSEMLHETAHALVHKAIHI